MKRIPPTRVIETGRVVRGSSGQGVGWLQSFQTRVQNLRAQVYGIKQRLNTPLRDGVPVAIAGELLFKANTQRQITIANYPVQQEDGVFVTPLVCNPIILSGQTYRIPIMFPPPGVFEARYLVVSIEAGYTMFAGQDRPGITPLNDYRQVIDTNSAREGFMIRSPNGLSNAFRYTMQQQVLSDSDASTGGALPYLPFFWNLVDEKSKRQYGQGLMPHGALLNTRGTSLRGARHPDGELFEFDCPWLFERDGQASFHFRPIMDLYQVDASSAFLPYGTAPGVDDRSQGRRFEQATVRVELHGIRYYDAQDLNKDGAHV